jgi:hypothetical protein
MLVDLKRLSLCFSIFCVAEYCMDCSGSGVADGDADRGDNGDDEARKN